MEQDSEHEEYDKKYEAGTLEVARSLSPVGRDQQPSETPNQLVSASFTPSLHFTLLDEDNATDNAVVSENNISSPSDSAAYGRQQFSPFFDLVSSGLPNKKTKSLRATGDARNPQESSGYTQPSINSSARPLPISSESMDSTNSVPFAPPPPSTPSLWRKFRNQLSNRVLKRHLRFMVALYLSSSLTLIRPVANFLGPMPFLANITVVFMHPARTVGSQLEVTLFSVIGAIIATAWIIPCQVSVAAYNQQFFAKHGALEADGHVSWAIEAAWFFVGIWIMTTLKARYAKLTCTFLIFTIANIFGYSKTNDNVKFNIHAYWALIGPIMIGVGICLIVSIVFWPETASEGLGRALSESLDTSRVLLNLSTRSFLLNHKTIALPKSVIENAQTEVRNAQKKLFTAYREARYEVTFATTDPADYKEVRVVVSALMRHLGSMSLVVQNERLLMLGHPDREIDDLETESGDGQDTTSSDDRSTGGNDSDDGSDGDIASDSMTGGGRGGRSGDMKYKRGSAVELRRIRQLLIRAEKSTDAVLQARKSQETDEWRKRDARSQSLGDYVRESATTPSSPRGTGGSVGGGRSAGAFERVSKSRLSTGTGGSSNSPGQLPIAAPIIRSSVSLPYLRGDQGSCRSSSVDSDRIDNLLKGSDSLFSGVSTAIFKPRRSSFHQKSSSGKDNRQLKRKGSGNVEALNARSGPGGGAGISPESGLPLPSSGAEVSGAHGDGGAGVGSSNGGFLEKLQVRHGASGSMSEYQVNKAAKAFAAKMKEKKWSRKQVERRAKVEHKRWAKQEREDDAAKDVPPKEVAFGDRKLFLSFLDTVREPLQRLSDSCSRSMATMERELVMELNVERDRMERIMKRKSHGDAIVRRAALDPSTHNAGNDDARNETPRSFWQRVLFKIGISTDLTRNELDFVDVVRSTRDMEKKRRVSKSGIPANSIHPRKFQLSNAGVLSGSGIEEDEGDAPLPGDMSYVQYLTQELEIFDQAEAAGLRGFIASHPTLDVGPREEIFLIFFFIFALREIGRELLRLGMHLEEMKRKQELQMELDGRNKPKKRLWWPKVIGNFEHWFAWGSYSQARASEGFSGLVMRSTRNPERREPRLFAEEKAHVVIKAAKAAEREAKRVAAENARREELEKRDRVRQSRNSETWDAPWPRRSMTMSAIFTRPAGHSGDLEGDGGDSTQFAPQPGRFALTTNRHARARTLLPFNARTGGHSTDARQPVIPVHPLSLDRSGSALEVVGSQDDSTAEGAETRQRGQYTVVDIPSHHSLHRRPSTDNGSSDMHLTSTLSPKVATIRSHLSASPKIHPLDRIPQTTHVTGTAASPSRSKNRVAEPHPSSQHRPSRVPLRKVTYTDQNDDGDDSEVSSFEQEAVRGYEIQSPRKRTQSAFADFTRRHPKEGSRLDEKYQKKRHRSAASAPLPLPSPPAFVNMPKPKSLRFRVWEFLQEFKSDEVRYGLKMATALTFVGLWAWLGWTYTLLATDRGQWVMMTIVAVLSPTIGATFSVCAWRVGGTLVGILWAMLTYLAYPKNPFVILAMMPFITFTGAYCILISTHPTMGVIMMLSYNSIVFGLYHGRTEDNIFETSYKVAVTMIIGILISVILNTFLWPVLARRGLRKEIALLIGRQGVLFAELVNRYFLEESTPRGRQLLERQADIDNEKASSYSDGSSKDQEDTKHEAEDERSSNMESRDPLSMGSKSVTGSGRKVSTRYVIDPSQRQDEQLHRPGEGLSDGDSHQEEYYLDADQLAFQHVEHQLQTKMIKIRQLLDLSASEPRLKEDFPGKLYKQIVQCCQNILDRMVSMRMAAQLLSTEVRNLVTGPMNYYRRDMVGTLLLYFSVLSSSLASKTALPPYLPSARMARLRVIYNVRQAIAARQAKTGEDHYTYIYYYAFSSALEEVIEELELLAILIKPLVGVTLVSSGGGYPCGFATDKLSLESAIPPMQIPVPPLQPGRTVFLTDDGSDLRLGLGTGIMQVPGPSTGYLDLSAVTSEQAQLEQHIQLQQIELQRQQQLQGVRPNSVLPGDSLQPGGATAHTMITGVTELPPSSQQQQEQQRHHRRCRQPGLRVTPILTQPFASGNKSSVGSPVVIMDPTLLDNRHAQRFKEAAETANEVSSVTSSPVSRSTSPRKKINERSPLIKEVLLPGRHHRRLADDDTPNSPYRIVPQRTPLVVESKETGIEPAKEAVDMALRPQNGLGLALSSDIPPHPVELSSKEEVHPFDLK
ncbi:hypothetical protein KI688_003706 [Linnemannia hyalina]|uniref:ER transporter 6TM N-terminal domain-containing protein n=1 Tax=Linnemannia hyalina TaxID=64524 RepID=A0A9P7XRR7_9FUNG|nr:hypothetical protein KI688_003706 [Linnemannia hyalina]